MKKKLLIGLSIIAIIICLIVLGNFLASRFLKPKLEGNLSSFLERPVEIKQVGMNFAFGRAVIKGITIENISGFPSPYLLKADKIIIEGSFLPFRKKRMIILRKLVVFDPEINIDYISVGKGNLHTLFSKEYSPDGPLDSLEEKKLFKAVRRGVFIKKILIKNAKINFNDYTKGEPYLTVGEGIDIGMNNFTQWLWAKGMETLFLVKGGLKTEPVTHFEIQGKLHYLLKGKINGAVELTINNINLAHFSPYFASKYHFLEVESGLANIYARIKCADNNLIGASKLAIKDYTLKPKDKKGASFIRIGDSLKGEGGEVELMLRIGGTIEKPAYVLSTDISEAKMQELFNCLPGLDLSATLLEGVRRTSSGFGKQIGEIFGKLFLEKKK